MDTPMDTRRVVFQPQRVGDTPQRKQAASSVLYKVATAQDDLKPASDTVRYVKRKRTKCCNVSALHKPWVESTLGIASALVTLAAAVVSLLELCDDPCDTGDTCVCGNDTSVAVTTTAAATTDLCVEGAVRVPVLIALLLLLFLLEVLAFVRGLSALRFTNDENQLNQEVEAVMAYLQSVGHMYHAHENLVLKSQSDAISGNLDRGIRVEIPQLVERSRAVYPQDFVNARETLQLIEQHSPQHTPRAGASD